MELNVSKEIMHLKCEWIGSFMAQKNVSHEK